MAREDLLLEVNGITKRFGGIVAVENVSFKVHEGEVERSRKNDRIQHADRSL